MTRFPLVIKFYVKYAVVGHRGTTGIYYVGQAREFITNQSAFAELLKICGA